MRLLILGGTLFLGRHVVDAALARGHEVTIFTRGRTGAAPAGVEALVGDRDGDLDALRGRSWDAVVDTSGYVPRVVGAGAALLATAVEHYVFVSSISVYRDHPVGLDEAHPVGELPPDHGEEVGRWYGELKAACERVVAGRLGEGRALAVRAGLIVGPHDPTGRYTWWAGRLARGGEVLAPAPSEQPAQLVDARDLAAWLVRCCEERVAGVLNATSPARPLREVLEATARGVGGEAALTWVDEAFLLEQGVTPWTELPLWVAPGANPSDAGFLAADVSRAVAAGLTFRPLEETARDALVLGGPPRPKAGVEVPPPGLAPEKEAAILAAWHARG